MIPFKENSCEKCSCQKIIQSDTKQNSENSSPETKNKTSMNLDVKYHIND